MADAAKAELQLLRIAFGEEQPEREAQCAWKYLVEGWAATRKVTSGKHLPRTEFPRQRRLVSFRYIFPGQGDSLPAKQGLLLTLAHLVLVGPNNLAGLGVDRVESELVVD